MLRLLAQLGIQMLCVQIVCLAAPRFAFAQTLPSAQTPPQNTQTGQNGAELPLMEWG